MVAIQPEESALIVENISLVRNLIYIILAWISTFQKNQFFRLLFSGLKQSELSGKQKGTIDRSRGPHRRGSSRRS